jgi:pyruvate,orthophosphate dikinase
MVKIGERMARIGHGVFDEVPSNEFGTKAAGLATMAHLGIPVPPAFSLSVTLCEEYYLGGERLPEDFPVLLRNGISFLETATGLVFGGSRRPLLVSVRSGAPVSMPGVMDTLLNVGLNQDTVRGLISLSGNPRFAWDSYRRLLQDFSRVVFRQDPRVYRTALSEILDDENLSDELEMGSKNLMDLSIAYERIFSATLERRFPADVYEQLSLAAEGVIRSWKNPRAEAYRKMNLLGDVRGTAVTVQAMVFGNMGSRSGAGVAFTRNPWQGTDGLIVDFRFGAQGEDVVSGDQSAVSPAVFSESMPDVFRELQDIGKKLEMHYRDMQDLEFTVQEGALFLLQTRPGKRSPYAALKIAVSLCQEGIISQADVIWLLRDIDLDSLSLRRVISRDYPVAVGIPASAGVASGKIAFSGEQAEQEAGQGHEVILVRETASPDDLPGIAAAKGLLTMRGARTSHAAVVARQMGKICVVNCANLEIDASRRRCILSGHELREGEVISIDGNSGNVYVGAVEYTEEKPTDLIARVRAWEREMQA